jgi:hypothetical protein
MRKLVLRVFDYSLDGIIGEENTDFFEFCRQVPDSDYPYADIMNQARKVVFSSTLENAGWANSTVLSGEPVTTIICEVAGRRGPGRPAQLLG